MGVSRNLLRNHIEEKVRLLGRSSYKFRQHWPSRLFRHESLENIVKIIQSGNLLSRLSAGENIARDNAPGEIIQATDVGHRMARLYFRPRNPTQYRIEGIRKSTEYYMGKHAPVLFMMIFRSQSILEMESSKFSDGNLQSGQSQIFDGDQCFSDLPFDQIYHEGPFDPASISGDQIRRRRCAEVLVQSPLALDGHLELIVCRSHGERTTLLHELGPAGQAWENRIRIATGPGVFQEEFTYVESVDGGPLRVDFSIHSRRDGGTVDFRMIVEGLDDQSNHKFAKADLDPSKKWFVEGDFQVGRFKVTIFLEGCLAYRGDFVNEEIPF